MRYYKIMADGKVNAIGTGAGGTEIGKEEYEVLLCLGREVASLANKVYAGQLLIGNVPEDLREEVRQIVDQRLRWQESEEDEDISTDEALRIILGGELS